MIPMGAPWLSFAQLLVLVLDTFPPSSSLACSMCTCHFYLSNHHANEEENLNGHLRARSMCLRVQFPQVIDVKGKYLILKLIHNFLKNKIYFFNFP